MRRPMSKSAFRVVGERQQALTHSFDFGKNALLRLEQIKQKIKITLQRKNTIQRTLGVK